MNAAQSSQVWFVFFFGRPFWDLSLSLCACACACDCNSVYVVWIFPFVLRIFCNFLFLLFLPIAVGLFASYFGIYSTILTSVLLLLLLLLLMLLNYCADCTGRCSVYAAYTLHRRTEYLYIRIVKFLTVRMWFICISFCALVFYIFLLKSYSDFWTKENWQILCITSCSEWDVVVCVRKKQQR